MIESISFFLSIGLLIFILMAFLIPDLGIWLITNAQCYFYQGQQAWQQKFRNSGK